MLRRLGPLMLVLLAPVSAAAADGPLLTSKPALYPSFSRAAADYVVRCPGRAVTFTRAAGSTVSIEGRRLRAARRVAIAPGQSLRVRVGAGGGVTDHVVRCLPDSFPAWKFERFGPQANRWYLMGVGIRFNGPPLPYAVIMDKRGVPVWWMRSPTPIAHDLKLIGGELAFTEAFPGSLGIRDATAYRFVHPDGTTIRTLRTAGSPTDHHELQAIGDDYLVLTYRRREKVDLSAFGGPGEATILDSEIQRLDRAGNLVWSWSSRDHIGLEEAKSWWPRVLDNVESLGDGQGAFDPTHINAVDVTRDNKGLLISLRHTDAVYRISLADGSVEWKLGGTTTPQSLRVRGDRHGGWPLGGQHDVRLWKNTITIHDNATGLKRRPRAVRYAIDEAAMTATHLETVTDSRADESVCCGSSRKLANGDWIIGWGGLSETVVKRDDGRVRARLGVPGLVSYRTIAVPRRALPAAALRAGMDAMFQRAQTPSG